MQTCGRGLEDLLLARKMLSEKLVAICLKSWKHVYRGASDARREQGTLRTWRSTGTWNSGQVESVKGRWTVLLLSQAASEGQRWRSECRVCGGACRAWWTDMEKGRIGAALNQDEDGEPVSVMFNPAGQVLQITQDFLPHYGYNYFKHDVLETLDFLSLCLNGQPIFFGWIIGGISTFMVE